MNTKKIILAVLGVAVVGGIAWWLMKGKSTNTAGEYGGGESGEESGNKGTTTSTGGISVEDLSKKATEIKVNPDGSQVKTDAGQVVKVSPQELKVQLPSGTATSGGNMKVSVG